MVAHHRVTATTHMAPLSECMEQLSELRKHSAAIEKEIAEIELRLTSLKKDLAADQATIGRAEAHLQFETNHGASFCREL